MTASPPAQAFTCELVVAVSIDGQTFEQVRLATREDAVIGNTELLAVPVPQGADHVARVSWRKPWHVTVVDGIGRTFDLRADEELVLEVGPYVVTFTLLPVRRLLRTTPLLTAGSLSWFAMVMLFSSLPPATVSGMKFLCETVPEQTGILPPFCPVDDGGGLEGGGWDAEYLVRLLNEDYAGEDQAVVQRDVQDPGKRDNKSVWLPAGAKGPTKELGGAAEVAVEPVRVPETEEVPTSPPEPEDVPEPELVAPKDVGTPIERVEPEEEPQEVDPVADLSEKFDESLDEDAEPEEAPAEEKEGFGLQDWYDERDSELDEMEIEMAKEAANERLKINPNDRLALSILSYYQYLDADFDGAEKTYDTYIRLYPEDSAGYNNKALIYKRKGEWAKEEGLYHVALAMQPNDVTALNNLAVNYAHQGRFAEAEQVMKTLEKLDPGEPYADLHRAKVYAAQGKVELALEYLARALEGMAKLDTLHHIEFRQDIRVDPSFDGLRENPRFKAILLQYYGEDTPLQDVPL